MIRPTPPGAPPLKLRSKESEVNLLHLKLYHHFQSYTIQTLLFSPEVWEQALQLSFQFDFLANAILCVSARHLSVLLPKDSSYSTTASAHLGRALSQFRHKLSGDFKSTHIDAFIATSLLLQYEIWTSTDDYSSPQDSSLSFDMPRDRIFAFCSSLKKMFLNCLPIIGDQPSVFLPSIRHDARNGLITTADISNNTLNAYQTIFSYERPLSPSSLNPQVLYTQGTNLVTSEQWQSSAPKIREVANPIDDCFKPIVTRLCLILSYLPESQPPASIGRRSSVIPELLKQIHQFPVTCHGPFNSMIQQGDPHALLLLFHFYRAVRILIPENECWWVHRRARVSEVALKDWLMRRTNTQADEETLKYPSASEFQSNGHSGPRLSG